MLVREWRYGCIWGISIWVRFHCGQLGLLVSQGLSLPFAGPTFCEIAPLGLVASSATFRNIYASRFREGLLRGCSRSRHGLIKGDFNDTSC